MEDRSVIAGKEFRSRLMVGTGKYRTHEEMNQALEASGAEIVTSTQIRIIIEQSTVPVVLDAGLGVPSDAAAAMEMGADACLINSAIALAEDPAQMGEATRLGVEAGRIPKKAFGSASSPLEGVLW